MVTIARSEHVLYPDPTRVVALPFLPGNANFGGGPTRTEVITERILALDTDETSQLLEQVRRRFEGRHRHIEMVWERGFELAAAESGAMGGLSAERRLLIGACFTQEFSFEAAALCNPSMVPTMDGPRPDGSLPFVMSLRAIGEGHISSIEFRSGTVDAEGGVSLEAASPYATPGLRHSPVYDKHTFSLKLDELGADSGIAHRVIDPLPSRFGLAALDGEIAAFHRSEISSAAAFETLHLIHWLASSNYELSFDDGRVSERVMSPAGPADSRGMEDARFVRFVDDDGAVTYYATYTAWDGHNVLPQLIETTDMLRFRIATLNGPVAQNKGMALFPRRIDGLYVALSRHDQENIFVMRSDHPRFWHNAELAYAPREPWEIMQLGNCGSPIETAAGWLVLTHGVGPMRQYALGALLLDLADPTKVIGRLRRPLLEPEPGERDGYVPNVVYSCGGLIHEGHLVVPYGFSDRGVRIAVADLDEVLGEMV